ALAVRRSARRREAIGSDLAPWSPGDFFGSSLTLTAPAGPPHPTLEWSSARRRMARNNPANSEGGGSLPTDSGNKLESIRLFRSPHPLDELIGPFVAHQSQLDTFLA